MNHIEIFNRRGMISEPDTDEYGRLFCNLYGDFNLDGITGVTYEITER